MNLAAAVSAYAERLHRDIGDEHHVASPLGAWLVLSLAASAADDDALVPVLGCSRAQAGAAARELLGHRPAELTMSAALWHATDSAALAAWVATLGPNVEVGPMPSQQAADTWARDTTFGLIERFPLVIDERTLFVLASAVAAKVDWSAPFGIAPAALPELPRSSGFAGIELLHSPESATAFVADTACGRVAVHALVSAGANLLVVSMIAADAVPSAAVLAAAHPVAVALATGAEVRGRLGLFELPLGAQHAWTVRETTGFGARDVERYDSVLRAWHAVSDHDLAALPSSGLAEAGEAVGRLVEAAGVDARQAALARYTRTGFQAAAITAMAGRAMAVPARREIRVRTALLEFTRPHAVVAVAVEPGSPWHGLPVFSAWVTKGDRPG